MIVKCWNCRGAASESFSRTFLEIVRINKPDIVILLETRCSGEKARKIISKSGFEFYHIEEAVGFSGGIWVMWKDPNIVISILKSKTQYVHMNVKKDYDEDWFLTAVYASPREVNRRELWNDIKIIKNGIRGPWLVVGDFNEIADPSEKKGGGRTDVGACKRFKRWIEECMLIDLGSVGPKFTWRGPQWENLERVFKRLDRALANADWRIKFHEARVEVLARVKSDHHPLLISMKPKDNLANNKPFRFEAMWSRHPDFKQFVESHWSGAQHWGRSLSALAENLMVWNKEVFGHIGRQKRSLMRRIGGIQKASSYGRNPFLEELERNLTNELEEILDREEIMWMQKSRDIWVVEGDRNTKYYHTKTIIRRRRNRILKLMNSQGDWIEDQEELRQHVVEFFKCLYRHDNSLSPVLITTRSYPMLEEDIKRSFNLKPTEKEIQDALFGIGSFKAPGPDGFPALFFKENWSIIKGNIGQLIHLLWSMPSMVETVNQTLITLIPKVKLPETINQSKCKERKCLL
ncbi:uncharacterized protein LOC107636029 [Arachis ipaensis]|uniref:uncharacterized protein LOC107636029 n=1 Tax=Arachis ipaensis TaxID=130454 RepID=UPI0007AF5362|nr:uncharacterized protein LOC107636029 [Arachis ipaensis]